MSLSPKTPVSETPHVPAAFINAIAEEGDMDEAVHYLQKTWNEACALKSQNDRLRSDLATARKALEEIDRHLNNFGYLPSMKARKLAQAALKQMQIAH